MGVFSKSKLKTGLRHPTEALKYFILGPQKYYLAAAEKRVRDAEKAERDVTPVNVLEERMVKPTDIHEHLATLYMLTIELDLKTIVELGTRKGEYHSVA